MCSMVWRLFHILSLVLRTRKRPEFLDLGSVFGMEPQLLFAMGRAGAGPGAQEARLGATSPEEA